MSKYKIYVFLFIILLVFSIFFVKAKSSNLYGKIIYIDPGHGGNDPGCVYQNIYEADINLEFSFILKKELENKGAIVYMTRYDDYNLALIDVKNKKRSDLNNRSNMINKSDCDLYISIHLNSYPSNIWKGAQVFYTDNNLYNIKLAYILQNELIKNTNTKREAKKITGYLFDKIEVPGVLIELGFLSNIEDRNNLISENYQKKLSKVITNGIVNYFKTSITI